LRPAPTAQCSAERTTDAAAWKAIGTALLPVAIGSRDASVKMSGMSASHDVHARML
jgi:hypothetical protein